MKKYVRQSSLPFLVIMILLFSLPYSLSSQGLMQTLSLANPELVGVFNTELQKFNLIRMAKGFRYPWSMEFLANGDVLITERGGRLLLLHEGEFLPVSGLPPLRASGQGGLLDIVSDPNFLANNVVYFSYAVSVQGGTGTAIARAILELDRIAQKRVALRDVRVIWEMERKSTASIHFGSRLRFLQDGTLVFTVGDRGQGERAQDLGDDAGKVHRIRSDGTIPQDNPYYGQPGVRESIYTYGHRNPQGLAVNPEDGSIWLSEHGPQGGDEINLIHKGKNYGWPIITYGRQYGSGAPIGEGNVKPGMEQPLLQWTPSIAPSGLSFYSGSAFPLWRGSLFAGSLAGAKLIRLTMQGAGVQDQETLLNGTLGRIREVKEGPDGYIYILTDELNASLYRLEPAE